MYICQLVLFIPGLGMINIISVVFKIEHHKKLIISILSIQFKNKYYYFNMRVEFTIDLDLVT